MPNADILEQIDNLVTSLELLEQKDDVKLYILAKEELEAGLNAMRLEAQELGNFQSKFYIFSKKSRKTIDWEKVGERLREVNKVNEKDLSFEVVHWEKMCKKLDKEQRLDEIDVLPFASEKIYGDARRIKQVTSVSVDA